MNDEASKSSQADEGRLERMVGRPVDEGTNTSGPRGTYGCACVADSAHACAEIRYGYRDLPEPCECLCHDWRNEDDDLG